MNMLCLRLALWNIQGYDEVVHTDRIFENIMLNNDAIVLKETWLTDHTYSSLVISMYILESNTLRLEDLQGRGYRHQSINQSINLFQFASFHTVLYIYIINILNTIRHKLGLHQR